MALHTQLSWEAPWPLCYSCSVLGACVHTVTLGAFGPLSGLWWSFHTNSLVPHIHLLGTVRSRARVAHVRTVQNAFPLSRMVLRTEGVGCRGPQGARCSKRCGHPRDSFYKGWHSSSEWNPMDLPRREAWHLELILQSPVLSPSAGRHCDSIPDLTAGL